MFNIKNPRKIAKLTQKELADRVGVTREHIAAIESGHKNPSLSLLSKIANELKIDIKELLNSA